MDIVSIAILSFFIILILLILFSSEIKKYFSNFKNHNNYVEFFTHNNVTFYMTKLTWKAICQENTAKKLYLQGNVIQQLNKLHLPSNRKFKYLIYFTQSYEKQSENSTSFEIKLQQLIDI